MKGGIITVREDFDQFIETLHRIAQSKIANSWVTANEVAELFNRIGAPVPNHVRPNNSVTVGVKTITFSVSGSNRAEIEEELRSITTGGFDLDAIESVELDWSNVEGLPTEDSREWTPGETDEEILATQERIGNGVRDWLMEQITHDRWCPGGVNEVLLRLGLEELPKEKEYTVRREVTGVWEIVVDAFSEEDAKRRTNWPQDSDGEASDGMVIIKTKSDDITVELVNENN